MKNTLYTITILIFGYLLGLFNDYLSFEYLSPDYFIKLLKKIGLTHLSSLFTAFLTFISSIWVVMYSQSRIKNKELAENHREEKIKIYSEFNAFVFDIRKTSKSDNQKVNAKEIDDFMNKFLKKIVLFASPRVINEIVYFQEASAKMKDNPSLKIFNNIEQIYTAMRKDIGLSNKNLIYNGITKSMGVNKKTMK